MVKFIKKLLDEKDSTSSKRFVALNALLLFNVECIMAMCGININEYVYYITAGLITAALLTSAIPKKQ